MLYTGSFVDFFTCIKLCQDRGMTMPCINGVDDTQQLTNLLRNSEARTDDNEGWQSAWVGLYQTPNTYSTREGWSNWVSAQCISTYHAWDRGSNPDDYACRQEACAVTNVGWDDDFNAFYDYPCSTLHNCVCEEGSVANVPVDDLRRYDGMVFDDCEDFNVGSIFRHMASGIGLLCCLGWGFGAVYMRRRARAREMANQANGQVAPMPTATATPYQPAMGYPSVPTSTATAAGYPSMPTATATMVGAGAAMPVAIATATPLVAGTQLPVATATALTAAPGAPVVVTATAVAAPMSVTEA